MWSYNWLRALFAKSLAHIHALAFHRCLRYAIIYNCSYHMWVRAMSRSHWVHRWLQCSSDGSVPMMCWISYGKIPPSRHGLQTLLVQYPVVVAPHDRLRKQNFWVGTKVDTHRSRTTQDRQITISRVEIPLACKECMWRCWYVDISEVENLSPKYVMSVTKNGHYVDSYCPTPLLAQNVTEICGWLYFRDLC